MTRLNVLVVVLACSLASSAQVLKGVVQNGTTKKPAAGDRVTLVKLGQGMEEQGQTKTDAKGEFSFKVADSSAPLMVRVTHQEVNYTQQVPPGQDNVNVVVYDSKDKVPEVEVVDQSEVYDVREDTLRGIELFRVRNSSVPPVSQKTFEFYLPEGATIKTAGVVLPSGLSVNGSAVPAQEKNKYVFMFPVRPGMVQFELVYTLPYHGSLKVSPKFAVEPKKLFVLTPRTMNFSPADSSAFHDEPWSIEPNFDVNSRVTDPAGKQVAYEISGAGSLPDDQGQQQQQQGNSRVEDNRPGGGLGVPNERPNPISSGQWAFLGVLSLFLAGGGVLVFYMNQQNPAAVPAASSATVMNALKEEMFQLESDKAQGKVTQQEYTIAKAALDRTLQRTMKRKK